MDRKQRHHLDVIKEILRSITFPERFVTDQTAICLLAMTDVREGRRDLLSGKRALIEGARINNILNFARADLDKQVAENTRESYRKDSMKPLKEAGIIVQHSTSVNDPNTWYEINAEFLAILAESSARRRATLVNLWNEGHSDRLVRVAQNFKSGRITLDLGVPKISLSPGKHNELIENVVTLFAPSFIPDFEVVYIGDAEDKMAFLHPTLPTRLGLSLDAHDKLPDVILYHESTNTLYIVEAVSSVGPISATRLIEIRRILEKKQPISFGLVLGSAFPDRRTFRKFVEDIAWDSFVWIATEGFGIIYFERSGRRP